MGFLDIFRSDIKQKKKESKAGQMKQGNEAKQKKQPKLGTHNDYIAKYQDDPHSHDHICAFCGERIIGSPKIKKHHWWRGNCIGTYEQKRIAQTALNNAKQVFKKARSLNLTPDNKLLQKAKTRIENGDYQNATNLCENLKAEVDSLIEQKRVEAEQKDNAQIALNDTEQVLQRAKSLNISPDEKKLQKAKSCIENGDYQEAIKLCENLKAEVDSLIEQKRVEAEQKDNAQIVLKDAEQVLQRAKSLNISPDEKKLQKAKSCIENGDYQEAINSCENLKAEVDSLKEQKRVEAKQKKNAQIALKDAEQVLQRAKSLNISPDEKKLQKAKSCIENGDYQEAIKLCGISSQDIESLIKDSKPSISISSSIPSLKLTTGKKTQIILKNEGTLPAKNFSLDFTGDMDIRVLSEIEYIKQGEAKPLDIWIKPKAEGDLPLDIFLEYKDALDRDYNKKIEIWIDVTEARQIITTQPPGDVISTSQFSPQHHILHLSHQNFPTTTQNHSLSEKVALPTYSALNVRTAESSP